MRKIKRPILETAEDEEPPINLTPLVDVVFVVLITFMIIAPILNVDQVDLASGGLMTKKEAKSTPLAVTISKDSSLLYQGKEITPENLRAILKSQKIRFPNESPQLLADKNAAFGKYQEVKNLFEECGFEQMDVILK